MDPYGRSPTGEGRRPDPDTGLEESLRRLGLAGRSGSSGADFPYPERLGEPDCDYFMRTGICGYGERCRYNHPRDRGVVGGEMFWPGAREYPERVGQPACQYYIKTGTCKFGSSCKYHHPRQGGGPVQSVSLNYYGYPLRPGEKECSYYMKTGLCKFGSTCKFHHPQPTGSTLPSSAPIFYPTVQPPSVPSAQQYPQVGGWQIGRPSSALTGAYMQSSYGPMVLSPGVVPVPGWSPYLPPLAQAVSPSAQQSGQAGPSFRPASQLSPSALAYPGPYSPVSSTIGPSSSSKKDHLFPERPGQPECQFYMRTGDCKFGSSCKYNHPPDWNTPKTNCILNPIGLPLRPRCGSGGRAMRDLLWWCLGGALGFLKPQSSLEFLAHLFLYVGSCHFFIDFESDIPINMEKIWSKYGALHRTAYIDFLNYEAFVQHLSALMMT